MAAGAGGAGALSLAPLYCAEIAPKARGLAAMPALACRYHLFNSVLLEFNVIALLKDKPNTKPTLISWTGTR